MSKRSIHVQFTITCTEFLVKGKPVYTTTKFLKIQNTQGGQPTSYIRVLPGKKCCMAQQFQSLDKVSLLDYFIVYSSFN